MATKVCGRCSAPLTAPQAFCERCGHRVGEPIPSTRERMAKPIVHKTMPMDPTPWPPGSAPERRRRLWPWLLVLCGVGFLASAAAGWFIAPLLVRGVAARYGLPTFVGDAEVTAAPVGDEDDAPTFDVELASLPSVPRRGIQLATPVYEITARGDAVAPFEISLPLLDPDTTRPVVIGHYGERGWEALPTEVVDGRAIAIAQSLSPGAGFHPKRRAPRSPAEAARLRVQAPFVLYGEATPEPAVVFDLRGCAYASDRAFGPQVAVRSLNVEVTAPEGDRPAPSPGRFRPYVHGGAPVRWSPRDGEGRLAIPLEPLARSYDAFTQVSYRRWDVRVVPVFEDGSTGTPSAPVSIYPDVLRAMVHLSREIPLDPATRASFDARVAAQPVRVVFGGYVQLRDAYNGSLPWSRRRGWGRLFGGVAGPHVGLTLDATYGDVVSHEWGHYAAHMALGDEYEATSPGGAHRGWVASTRGLAFTEDLATVLGQWATGAGVPPAAGAMFGRTRDMSRRPEGEGVRWPSARDVDAVAVEIVPATVMSRLAHELGFATLFATIASARPPDLIALVTALGPSRAEVLQPILIDEGVSWLARGRVVRIGEPGTEPAPLAGARVRVRTLAGVELVPPPEDAGTVQATTAADGTFTVRVPAGEVLLVAEAEGLAQRNRVTFAPDASIATNAAAQAIPTDLELEAGLQVLLESPAAGATVTERIQVVTGRVVARQGTVIDRVTLRTATGEVQVPLSGDRFEGRVTLTPGDNTITATAHAGVTQASASVTVRAEIAATILMCELTWTRDGTDVDLWVTDPQGVSTGFSNRTPREGRLLDVDNTRGYGPETYTMSTELPGAYQVRVNYYSGQGPVSFRVRWCVREATPAQQCGATGGTLTESDRNAGTAPGANHRFAITVP